MQTRLIEVICSCMSQELDDRQNALLRQPLGICMEQYDIQPRQATPEQIELNNEKLVKMFLAAKRVEGCSEKTARYYELTLTRFLKAQSGPCQEMSTDVIRTYLSDYQQERNAGKVTIDNLRRILSSFFCWLEDEDYVLKSPVRRINKIKTIQTVKETISDENMEKLRDACSNKRDLAILDFLASTGVRVGELVGLNLDQINFRERSCVVLGKGEKEREVYFDAKAKLHLKAYLADWIDDNPALFVSLRQPYERLSINGVEKMLQRLGKIAGVAGVHPHKFRRTMATVAIDKGMPIEQVKKLLGHTKINTTLQYAMVNQENVRNSHRKYLE